MTVSLGSLRTDVRQRLDETTQRFWSDQELNRWIEEGARDLARRAELLQDRFTIATTTGTQEYTMPTDLFRAHRAEWTPDGVNIYPLEQRSVQEMDVVWGTQRLTQSSYPNYWSLWGFPPQLKVLLFPVPSQTGTLTIWYYRAPTQTSQDTDPVDVPTGWEDLIAQYCEYIALRKDADPRWKDAKELYEQNLGDMIDVTRRWVDATGLIVGPSGGMYPSWLTGGGDYY